MTPNIHEMTTRLLAAADQQRQRFIVALAGPPAAGKSFLSGWLCRELNVRRPGCAAIVPMDGYHFDNAVLAPQGRLAIKGAPETFDCDGLKHDLERIRRADRTVAVPVFDRPLDLARAGGRLILPEHRLVLVEGNYLLLDVAPWRELHALFDLTLFIEVPDAVLVERLLARWRGMGEDAAVAHARTHDKDMLNARLVNDRSVAPTWRWHFHAELRHPLGPNSAPQESP
ncbi:MULTISPECIES: nucleoside triphosphate hydrolase [Halomonadaceae]|uniref:Nucleoside triphosphate hydrolase n=1 Tax=Modicisalibacter zincidurans TaxID=1178777 RepID=A0ABP9R4R3_9GAMM|nr:MULTISPECIES: nucleoside triphosphate hydrolase [Halomonas]MCD6009717.1 nucleoside triphosphate hydrolase [Halomonas sp. IOP_31]MEA3253249.1 nucleoside triphosphate hydrolase [Pseudomonadota bacterium]